MHLADCAVHSQVPAVPQASVINILLVKGQPMFTVVIGIIP